MKAAIYCRKSTEQKDHSEEAKSVTRQKENAKRFIEGYGWTLFDVYVDDGISGAEFDRRPGLQSMLAHSKEFDILVVSEQKSLGRESFATQYLIRQLAESGVEVYEYVHGQLLTPKTWLDKAMSSVRSWADEAHREGTRERVHEALAQKFAKGYVVGGRVFGYRNIDVEVGIDEHGRAIRSHVIRMIVPEEAEVIVRIFELYTQGYGLKRIAKMLNAEGTQYPKSRNRKDQAKTNGWSPSTVRTVLRRSDYRGVLTWNRTKKRDDWGQVNKSKRPKSEWVEVSAPHLRIVSDELWNRVASRIRESNSAGRNTGRPSRHTKNLLAGLATCALCGGGLVVETSARKSGRIHEYVCSRRRTNGTCDNDIRMPVDMMNEAVLAAIEEHALTPEAIEHVIKLSEEDDLQAQRKLMSREVKALDRKIKNITTAIENGGDIPVLVQRLRELQEQRGKLHSDISGLRPIPRLEPQVVDDCLAEWRRQIRGSTTQGRAVLQQVLRGRITFTPIGDAYEFECPTRYDRLFVGVAGPGRSNFKAPEYMRGDAGKGYENLDAVGQDYAEIFERGYRLLLEKAQSNAERLVSPTGLEPVLPP